MSHKFDLGTSVYYEGGVLTRGALGAYEVLGHLPVERDDRLMYRIKNTAEKFERTAEEHLLTRAE
jgi:hypothetical protein